MSESKIEWTGSTLNAIPPGLRDAPQIDVLAWADCYLRHGPLAGGRISGWMAVDARTGEVIADDVWLWDRLSKTWAWLRAAEGRFAEFEELERLRRADPGDRSRLPADRARDQVVGEEIDQRTYITPARVRDV